MIARCTPWGTIQLGDEFFRLARFEQRAVLAHEHGHIRKWHAWARIWWLVTLHAFFRTDDFLALCQEQEMEADRYAVEQGYRTGLISVLTQVQSRVKSAELTERLEALRG